MPKPGSRLANRPVIRFRIVRLKAATHLLRNRIRRIGASRISRSAMTNAANVMTDYLLSLQRVSLQRGGSAGTFRVTRRHPGCYRAIESPYLMCIMMNLPPNQWALNSAVECHPHTVEVVGSNPTAPTTRSNGLARSPCRFPCRSSPSARFSRVLQPCPVLRPRRKRPSLIERRYAA
jgi:hypothetical protein